MVLQPLLELEFSGFPVLRFAAHEEPSVEHPLGVEPTYEFDAGAALHKYHWFEIGEVDPEGTISEATSAASTELS
jgi:hypothetical protein